MNYEIGTNKWTMPGIQPVAGQSSSESHLACSSGRQKDTQSNSIFLNERKTLVDTDSIFWINMNLVLIFRMAFRL